MFWWNYFSYRWLEGMSQHYTEHFDLVWPTVCIINPHKLFCNRWVPCQLHCFFYLVWVHKWCAIKLGSPTFLLKWFCEIKWLNTIIVFRLRHCEGFRHHCLTTIPCTRSLLLKWIISLNLKTAWHAWTLPLLDMNNAHVKIWNVMSCTLQYFLYYLE